MRFVVPSTVLCWCLAVGVAVWTAMRLMVPPPHIAPAMPAEHSTKYSMDQSAEARLLGVETAGGLTPPAVKLIGVFASSAGRGAAVLSIEGQPAQSKMQGHEISNGWVLDEVAPTHIVLGRSGQRHRIDLPLPNADPTVLIRVPAGNE